MQKKDRWEGYEPTPIRLRREAQERGETTSLRSRHRMPAPPNAAPVWRQVDRSAGPDACWPWLGSFDRYGYGFDKGIGRAHRAAFASVTGAVLSPDIAVLHSCDNPACCNPRHLRAGTQDDNVADRVGRGRSARGAFNGRAKLSATDAAAIYKAGGSASEVARRFKVSERTVRDIRSGRTWRWLTNTGRDIPK